MSNRRIKDIQYDDDEYDDGYSDDEPNTQELSQDDKGKPDTSSYAYTADPTIEQMRLGTIQIRQILGDSDHISDHAIEEALWHYYYDIEKSVTYLKSTFEYGHIKWRLTPGRSAHPTKSRYTDESEAAFSVRSSGEQCRSKFW